jgi:hypothetical protein
MKYRVINNSNLDMDKFRPLLNSFLPFVRQKMGFDRPVSIYFVSDPENAENPLGRTAHYDPGNDSVSVYTDQRHPKDILRSLSHELVHHAQNCRGEFDRTGDLGEDYFQNDPHMQEIEITAYKEGNEYFRMWEEKYRKQLRESIYYYTGEKLMKRIDSRRHKLNSLLMENFGYTSEEGGCPSEEGRIPEDGPETLYEEELETEELYEEEELEEISRIREVVRRALRKRSK